jgi:hypothetical protein
LLLPHPRTGQSASWLTWAELAGDGSDGTPSIVNHVGANEAVFGPFDCAPAAAAHNDDVDAVGERKVASPCPDSKGTEDPRITYDPETALYYLLYNAWGDSGVFLSLATTRNPTNRTGWTRHGPLFPAAKIGSYKSGSIVLMPSPTPHYVIWGCSGTLRITPTVGRDLTAWNFNATKDLLSTRSSPFWDTEFVESAMPPLPLSDGNLLFFYDSMGSWNGSGTGFQVCPSFTPSLQQSLVCFLGAFVERAVELGALQCMLHSVFPPGELARTDARVLVYSVVYLFC